MPPGAVGQARALESLKNVWSPHQPLCYSLNCLEWLLRCFLTVQDFVCVAEEEVRELVVVALQNGGRACYRIGEDWKQLAKPRIGCQHIVIRQLAIKIVFWGFTLWRPATAARI